MTREEQNLMILEAHRQRDQYVAEMVRGLFAWAISAFARKQASDKHA